MKNHIRKSYIFLMVIALLATALACNLPRGETVESPVALEQADQPESALPADEAPPPEGEQPADEPPAPSGGDAAETGMSRTNPYPIDTEVVTPYWDFRVLEFHRGDAAWQIIQADDTNNRPPPPGKEYALVKVWLRNKNPEVHAQNIGLHELFITGDSLQEHADVLIGHPAPEIVYGDIYTAEILEGWIDVLVAPSEGNLMLVFDREDRVGDESQPREVRYVALEPGASIQISAELEAIAPNDLGLELENPAKIGETVIGEDWEVTILEAVHGETALDVVMQMNDKNKPPEEGLEYVAFRARMRRTSTEDRIDGRASFWVYAPGKGQHSSDFLSEPRGVNNKNPENFPWMHFYFFPGLESEGWFVLAAPAGQTPQIARLDVGGDFLTKTRYFLLTP